MKLKDLIKELEQYNPETEVYFSNVVECFHSVSGCNYDGDIQIQLENHEDVEEMKEDMDEDTECNFPELNENEEILVITISGEENFNG